ncbi:hypothetical protein D3H65_07055 [Paraflavitalea soli]|uniref:Uncharacterized protein n=1 Tax=Paraflavitalea soli TaxID=2315862 RepID=A0A3B7MHR1_9BACT|nr:hypothetical protein [Paraflavitalea soli]AXY73748.1 hypothetical protein D3H65_07055 [Paraflavitalea soli]
MKKVPAGTWIVMLLSVLFLGGMIIYWYNYNAKATIADLQKDMKTLVDTSVILPKAKVSNAVRIEQKLTNKDVTAPLNLACSDFFKAWNNKLTKAQADTFRTRIDTQAGILKFAYAARSGNQLLAVLLISVIVITFFCLAFFTNLLRDPQGSTSNTTQLQIEKAFWESMDNDPEKASPPFSLSRTQLAVWITIISSVYLYAILWDKRNIGEINNTALLLMGISAGTFAVGAIMDTTEIEQGVVRHQEAQPSINFFRDLLTDNNGISVHRFQNVVWTIVSIMVYFYRYSNPPDHNFNNLPTLDTTLLALTGISNATYLTLKTRENVSLKKPVTLNIKLLLDDSVAEKAAILATAEGLNKAVINIITSIGEEIHAMPNPADAKDTFIAKVEPDKFQKIEATWQGKDAMAGIKLNGSFAAIIKDTPEEQTIEITLKKQQ